MSEAQIYGVWVFTWVKKLLIDEKVLQISIWYLFYSSKILKECLIYDKKVTWWNFERVLKTWISAWHRFWKHESWPLRRCHLQTWRTASLRKIFEARQRADNGWTKLQPYMKFTGEVYLKVSLRISGNLRQSSNFHSLHRHCWIRNDF